MEFIKAVKAMGDAGVVQSHSQARRLLASGWVKINGKVVKDIMADVKPGDEVQLGRRTVRKFAVPG